MERKPLMPLKMMLPIGLLLIAGTSIINRFVVVLPDFATGSLMGIGIGLMIVSIIKQNRAKASA